MCDNQVNRNENIFFSSVLTVHFDYHSINIYLKPGEIWFFIIFKNDYLFISQHPQYLAQCSYNLPSVTSRSRLLAWICISAISDINSVFLFFTTHYSDAKIDHRKYRLIFSPLRSLVRCHPFRQSHYWHFKCKRTNPTVIKSNEGTQWQKVEASIARGQRRHLRVPIAALVSLHWVLGRVGSAHLPRRQSVSENTRIPLFLISANVELSVSLVTPRQAPLRKKKRGRRQLRTNVGWGLAGYQLVKHKPNETVSSDQLAS